MLHFQDCALFVVLSVSLVLPGDSGLSWPSPTLEKESPESTPQEAPVPENIKSQEQLFTAFSGLKSLSACFSEEKHMKILLKPITTKGRLYYEADNKCFSQFVDSPFPFALVVNPALIGKLEAGHWTLLEGDLNRVVRQVLVSFTKLLEGDSKSLQEVYLTTFELSSEDQTHWTLSLKPRKEPLSKLLKQIKISGRGRTLLSAEVLESSGDRRVMSFSEIKLNRPFSIEERAQYFPRPE